MVDLIPALVKIQQTGKRGQGVCERVAGGVQAEVAQLREAAFQDEDVGERWVADDRLQLEYGHLANRVLLGAEALDELGNVDVLHIVSSKKRSGGGPAGRHAT